VLDGDLLVLGSHGHGQLHAAVVGSTVESCIGRSPCPVVAVPTAMRVERMTRGQRSLGTRATAVRASAADRPSRTLIPPRDLVEF
jgi:hypothetical protein